MAIRRLEIVYNKDEKSAFEILKPSIEGIKYICFWKLRITLWMT